MKNRLKAMGLSAKLVAVLSVLALLIAACGDADEAPETEPEEEATETEEEESEAEEPEGTEEEEAAPDDEIDNPFAGETITFVIGYGPGGGFDTYARLLGPALADALDANIEFVNQPGAGGLVALNELMVAGPDDGFTISIMNGKGLGSNYAAGDDALQFDLIDDVAPIGRIAADPIAWWTGEVSGYETVEDVIAAGEFTFGASGTGSSSFVSGRIMQIAFELDGDMVTGYEGSDEVELAALRGEVDGQVSSIGPTLPQIEAGDIVALTVHGDEEDPLLPGVPPVLSLDMTDEGRELLETDIALDQILRILVLPASAPQEHVDALRWGYDQVFQDEAFVQQAEDQDSPLAYLPGAEVEALISSVLGDVPQTYIELVQEGLD